MPVQTTSPHPASPSRARFTGKTVIVTGGAGGIGRAASVMFAAEGARVAILDLAADAGAETQRLISEAGGEGAFFHTNVAKPAEVEVAVASVVNRFGIPDVLFSHAGTIIVKPFDQHTDEDYDRLMDINVRSAFVICRAIVPLMVNNGGGSIVITSSIGGEKGFALESLYCMTKGAVLQLARSLAAEYRDRNIRANAVCPGFVRTAHGLREIDELDRNGQAWEAAALAGAQGRICEPEEVASAALFLASDEASFTNGAALYVDNGWYAKG